MYVHIDINLIKKINDYYIIVLCTAVGPWLIIMKEKICFYYAFQRFSFIFKDSKQKIMYLLFNIPLEEVVSTKSKKKFQICFNLYTYRAYKYDSF